MVDSDTFTNAQVPPTEAEIERAVFFMLCQRVAAALRGPTGRGTPPKWRTVMKTARTLMRNAKLGIVQNVVPDRGFRPITKVREVPAHIQAIWKGVK